MNTIANHPLSLAAEVARLLDADPVMAGQVKEHISEERLAELLGLTPKYPEVPSFEQMLDELLGLTPKYPEVRSFEQMLDELEIPDDDALQYVLSTFSKAQILRALNED